MPFLRVIRDKRGYETTYLMHWYREGARQRSRILYVFRTPGGVRVGREPLESDVQRIIEAQYPDIVFDWKAVLDSRQVIESAPVERRPRKGPGRRDERGAPPAEAAAAPEAAPRPDPVPAPPSRPAVPAAIEGTTTEEQIAFLSLWYERLRERIPQRTMDAARQEALLALTERLNPASWADADQVASGLPQAAEALERLSHVFAKRRRRSRKPKGAPRADGAATPDAAPEPVPASPSSEE